MQLSEQEVVRREKLSKLRELGINPYPADLFPVNHNSKQIKENYAESKQVVIAGRLMSRRIQGKASFAELQDAEGRIQVYFNRDEICTGEDKTLYNDVYKKLLDIGDFIGIKGELFTTQVGEKSVRVHKFVLLSKALKPLPLPRTDADGIVHDAFTDPELRYRQRYADLVVNPKVKDSVELCNYLFYHHPDILIDSSMENLIFELQNTERDADGGLIKDKRDDATQRADFVDCWRYLANWHFFLNDNVYKFPSKFGIKV